MRSSGISGVIVAALCVGAVVGPLAVGLRTPRPEPTDLGTGGHTLDDAQHLFYNARYEEAADLALVLRSSGADGLASDEFRSTALLFQLKALLEKPGDDNGTAALKTCITCPKLIADFFTEIHHGQDLARSTLKANPADESALFFLGKLDLNYVWLQVGPLRRRTGLSEYWEARRSLDAVLKSNPRHVRARVARAWMEYIVDTRMPWGTRWVLGGGNKKHALAAAGEAARMEADFYAHVESEFALWNMLVRERNMTQATDVAQRLVRQFPENREVTAFLNARAAATAISVGTP